MTAMRILTLAVLMTFATGAALAQGGKTGSIEVEHPWARATAPSARNGAAYLTLTEHGGGVDRLVSVSTPVAGKAELHTTLMDNGVMKMRPLDTIEVTPGASTKLQPGGMHIMLLGLTQPLVNGKAFPLTLTFEKAGSVTVQVDVQGAAAASGHGMGEAPKAH